jgi:peptidoglycan hydrolase-like protein with peptidoglycan-binding domain
VRDVTHHAGGGSGACEHAPYGCYATYGADGVFGRSTRAAIGAWQRDEAVEVTGYLTADQVRQIRVDTGGEGGGVLREERRKTA